MSLAVTLLAAALLVAGGDSRPRLRNLVGTPATPTPPPVLRPHWATVAVLTTTAAGWLIPGGMAGAAIGAALGAAGMVAVHRLSGPTGGRQGAPVELAAAWDVVAVCLASGLPVATGVRAAAELVPGPTGRQLHAVSGRLHLGADPRQAWSTSAEVPGLTAFARAAGRSAGTGSALAAVARAEAARIRGELVDGAQERAQRAAVRITAPLGVCFLPAFLILGVAPVVVGLASEALARW